MIGRAEVPTTHPSLRAAAVAASVHGRGRHAGYAWVCADGRWALNAAIRPPAAELFTAEYAELRAVAWLLAHLTPPVLLTRNREAARHLRLWQGGDLVMPPGFAGSTHVRRASGVIAGSPQIRVSRVGAHPLTTAAALLALVARERAGSAAKRCRAQAIVESFLSWQQEEVA